MSKQCPRSDGLIGVVRVKEAYDQAVEEVGEQKAKQTFHEVSEILREDTDE